MKERKSEAEIEAMQKAWGNKHCDHDQGYGYEWNDKLGVATDYYCLKCGMRYFSKEFFDERMKK